MKPPDTSLWETDHQIASERLITKARNVMTMRMIQGRSANAVTADSSCILGLQIVEVWEMQENSNGSEEVAFTSERLIAKARNVMTTRMIQGRSANEVTADSSCILRLQTVGILKM